MEAERRKLGCNLQLWRLIMSPDLSVMTLFIWDHFLLLYCSASVGHLPFFLLAWQYLHSRTCWGSILGLCQSKGVCVEIVELSWPPVPHSSLPQCVHHSSCVCESTWMYVCILFFSSCSLSSILPPSFLSPDLSSLYFVEENALMDVIFYQGRQEQL